MPDRRRQVIQLYATRHDLLYLPAGALATTSGLAPSTKAPCPSCGHLARPGRVVDAFKRESRCEVCGGKGWVFVDRMDTARVPIGDRETKASARPARTVLCDGCAGDGVVKGARCRYCDGHGRRPLHVFDLRLEPDGGDGADPLCAAIDRRNQAGSYHELDVAISGLYAHVNKPARFAPINGHGVAAIRLLDEVFVPPQGRSLPELRERERALVELALGYLVWRMPDPIRVPADVRANDRIRREHRTRARGRGQALAVRDREIRKLVRAGKAAQWIAGEYGLSVASVYAIANTKTEAA